MFCPECGKKIEDNSKFCMECGAKMEDYDASNVKTSASEFLTKKEKGKVDNNIDTREKKNNKNAIIALLALGIIVVGVIGLQIYGEDPISNHVNIFNCQGSFNSEFDHGTFSNQYYVAPMDVYNNDFGTKYNGGAGADATFDKSYENVQFYVEYLSKDGKSLQKSKANLYDASKNYAKTKNVVENGHYRIENADYYGSEKPDRIKYYVNNRNDGNVDENRDYVCEFKL